MSSNTLKRRKQSTENYIDALLQNNSKLCAIRVDLKYKEPFAKDVSQDVINKDLKRMLDNRRNNKTIFGNNLGYIIKKEVSGNGNLHLHAMFLEDGSKVQKAAYKADQIGKYWSEEKIKSKNSDEHIGDTNSISNEKWSEIKEYQHLHLFLRAVWGFLFNYLTQAIHIKHCKHL